MIVIIKEVIAQILDIWIRVYFYVEISI